MAIQVNLDVMLARRKMTLSELASKVDITLANLSVLKTGRARAIRFSTLDRLCRALDCQPGDLAGLCAGGDGNMTKAPRQGKNTRVAAHCYA